MTKIAFQLFIVISLLSVGSHSAFAQKEGEIQGEEIVIIKERPIELPEANRNFEKIASTAPAPIVRQQEYDYTERNFQTGDLKLSPRVLQLPQEPLKKLYGNYVKAGFGNYSSPYLEAFINSKRTDDYAYGLHFKHLSSMRGPVEGKNSATSQNELGVNGKYFTDLATLSGGIQYNRDKYYFYGYKQDRPVDRKDIEQVFNTIAFDARVTNAHKEADIDYDIATQFTNLKDNYEAAEFDWTTNVTTSYKVSDQFKGVLDGDFFITKRKDSLGSLSRNLIKIKPYLYYKQEQLLFKAGLNLAFENDTISTAKSIHVYPFAEAAYAFSPKVSFFAGFDGDMQRTSLRLLVKENPFLIANVPLAHTNKLQEFYGGLRGNLNPVITYEIKAGMGRYRNLYFFNNAGDVQHQADTSRFTVLYNKDVTNVLNFSGQFSYNASERFRSALKFDAYNYKFQSAKWKAWHRPTFTATWHNTFNLKDKVYLNADFYYLSGMLGKNPLKDAEVKLDPIIDLNLKIDYLFSNNFSAFLSLNNIFAQKYQRYLYYPQQGLNVLVGLTYSF